MELQDIELNVQVTAPTPQAYPSDLMEEASKISGGEWQEVYKRCMGETYQKAFALLEEPPEAWSLLATNNEGVHPILLFERNDSLTPYARVFRLNTVVEGRGERFVWLLRDHDAETRLAWDATDVVSVQQLETYRPAEGDIDVVKCEVRSPYAMLVSNRLLLGVQQAQYNATLKTHTYVYHTAPHYYFTHHLKETVHRKCTLVPHLLVCVWLSPMEHGKCRLQMVVCVDAGSMSIMSPLINATYPEKLCAQVLRWQRVVREWDTYYPNDPKLVENRK